MDNFNHPPVSTKEWILTLLLTFIPIVNIIMLFIWAFGSGHNPSKSNWAKAALIWAAVFMVFYVILGVLFGVAIFNNSSDMPEMNFGG